MEGYTTSKDGTRIAYSCTGYGNPLILVDGALCHRKFGANQKLPGLLSHRFSVYSYDRRGRGESGDTLPYSVEKEYEDLAAVMQMAGGSASIYGISSGAALVLEAASYGLPIKKMALYEAPFVTDDTRKPFPPDYRETLGKLVEERKPGKALEHFFRAGIGLPGIVVWMMKRMEAWKQMRQIASTLVYDTDILGDTGSGRPFPKTRWARVTMPVLVMAGTKSPAWSQNSMRHLAAVLPNAVFRSLNRQTHMVDPALLADTLIDYFQES